MEEGEKKVIRRNSGKSFKSRVHDKTEKRKQRKEWLKRKREKMRHIGTSPRLKKNPQDLKQSWRIKRKQHKDSIPTFKELNRNLLSVYRTEPIDLGTFGRCFPATYRQVYRVIVEEMKMKDTTKEELERAKREVIGEATVLSKLGDHPGIPHLFGVF